MLDAEEEHGDDGGDQQGHEGLAQEVEDRLDTGERGDNAGDGLDNDEDQGDEDDGDDGAELGELGLVNVLLGADTVGHRNHVLVAAVLAEDGAGHDHGGGTAEDAEKDDPTEVNAQHGGDEDGARRGRDEGVADSETGEKRNGIEQGGTLRALGEREGQGNQDDEAGVEEHGHCDDHAGDAEGPGRFFIAELFDHGHGEGLCAA